MHSSKHEALAAVGQQVARLVLNAAVAHSVHVDEVVREALMRGPRPSRAKAALASLPQDVRVKLSKLAWPWDCPICLDAVDSLTACPKGHAQCGRCSEAECPVCQVASRVLADRKIAEASE